MNWNIFGGAFTAVENVAKEWIETDKEAAEAKALFVKTLDPNGRMRRDLSRFASVAFGFYLVNTAVLVYMQAFGIGDTEGAAQAAGAMKDLFGTVITAWGAIVTASFGVNGVNSFKGK